MKIGIDAALGIHPDALALRARRTEILANNMANADTPNFKARDIDFKQAMASVTSGNEGQGIRTTHARHIAQSQSGAADAQLGYRTPVLPSLDGNTVDGHIEQSEMASNNMHLLASLRFVDSRFKGLTTAIKGE